MKAAGPLGALVLACAFAPSATAGPSSPDSVARVDVERESNDRREWTTSSTDHEQLPPLPAAWAHSGDAHYGRAALEMFGFLGLGAAWYWLDIDRNLADWDRLSIEQRFRWEAVRLDNNEFAINYVAHPFVGSAYYAFARSNGLNVLEAAVYTKLTSMAWEYGLEFQERTSYNDFFVTPLGGIGLGEAFHALGLYVNSGRGALAQNLLAWSLGLPTALHRAIDGVSAPPVTRRDALGFDADVAHEFEASYAVGGLRTANTDSMRHSLRLSSELMAIPGYGTDRAVERWFCQGLWTRLAMGTHFSSEPTGLEFSGHSVLAGFHHQAGEPRRGHAATTGLGLGFDYSVFRATEFKQQAGLLHIGGLYHKALLRWFDLQFELRARVSPDFSAANSLPYQRWWSVRGDAEEVQGKSILRKQGYYYGWGWSSELALELRWRVLALGAVASYQSLDSISGLDRTQEQLDLEERARDDWDVGRIYARLLAPNEAPPLGTLRGRMRPFAELSFERLRRRSQVEDVSLHRTLSEASLRFGLEF